MKDHHTGEGWEQQQLPLPKLLPGKRPEIVSAGMADCGMFRAPCLHIHNAGFLRSSGAPSNLAQQLIHPLSCTERRKSELRIGIDHADHRDVGEVEAFGNQLSSNQNICLPAQKLLIHSLMPVYS